MNDLFLALWSGGKDSSWMIIEILERKLPLDFIVTYDTPELPDMYEYKTFFEKYIKDKFNAKVITIPTGRMATVFKWSLTPYTKGKFKGMARGFPKTSAMTWCTRELKVNPYNRFVKNNYPNANIKKYYGIAIDEPKRLYKDKNGIYLLADLNLTEKDCLDNLNSKGLHNKIYNHYKRTGCWMCPKQGKKGFKILYDHYPDMWVELKKWEHAIGLAGDYNSGVHIKEIIPGFTVQKLEELFKNQSKQMELLSC